MKSIIFIILVVLSYSIFADDITTTDGLTYKNATVAKMTDDTMILRIDIPRSKLSDSVWSKYANIKKQKTNTINIKGFYLGMPMKTACELHNQYLIKNGVAEKHKCYVAGNSLRHKIDDSQEIIETIIKGDENQLVTMIHFEDQRINDMFGVENMSNEDFRSMFSKNFNIPEKAYKMVTYEDKLWYEYKSPEGFILRLADQSKELILQKSVSPTFK